MEPTGVFIRKLTKLLSELALPEGLPVEEESDRTAELTDLWWQLTDEEQAEVEEHFCANGRASA